MLNDDIALFRKKVDIAAYVAGEWAWVTYKAIRADVVALIFFYDDQSEVTDKNVTVEDKLTVFVESAMADATYRLAEGFISDSRRPLRSGKPIATF